MGKIEHTDHVNIKPGIRILSVLRHLNYKPWFALAEFVDNSLQSFLHFQQELRQLEGSNFKLKVDIELDTNDQGRIIIRDNAAGIHERDYTRAFRPAEIPSDQTGLSEFGMGMKSAACWFAENWAVRTSALGEPVERIVTFDIEEIIQDNLEELKIQSHPSIPEQHYTEIVLTKLNKLPQSRTIAKIREHLVSIYRVFIREGQLELRFNNELLEYTEPKVLHAPFYKDEQKQPMHWRKEIAFDFGLGLRVKGFAAIRDTASVSYAGFGLFRRQRLIEGSADDTYRPAYIFGPHNGFVYQRLFGELHLEGFEVSHTKDGFRWEEHEDAFLQILKDELNKTPLPLIEQAGGYRAKPKPQELVAGAEKANQRTAEVIKRDIPQILEQQIKAQPELQNPPTTLPVVTKASQRIINVTLNQCEWQIILELSDDPSVGEWVSIYDQPSIQTDVFGNTVRRLGVRLSLAHPFMQTFGGTHPSQIEPLLRIAAAIALGETAARDSGVKMAGTIRRNVNELLRDAFSKLD